MCLVLCCAFFLLPALLYGYGALDNVMLYLTNGEVDGMAKREKLIALWIGWGAFLTILGFLMWVIFR